MPERIPQVGQRVAVIRLVVWLVRSVAQDYLAAEMAASVADDAILCCAILIGQVDRRPMTATKLCQYIGMPRPTVFRKVRDMEKRGLVAIVNRKVMLPADKVVESGLIETVSAACRQIHRISEELSKLDGHAVVHTPLAPIR